MSNSNYGHNSDYAYERIKNKNRPGSEYNPIWTTPLGHKHYTDEEYKELEKKFDWSSSGPGDYTTSFFYWDGLMLLIFVNMLTNQFNMPKI